MANKNILIVEDERIVAEDIRSRLIKFGYSVQAIVSTIQSALKQINSNDINLVLLDIELEGPMDGIKLAEELNANYDIPVVYLTAHSDKEILERAKKTEPFGFLIKPFEERELNSTIETALYKHGMERETREREAWFSTTLTSIGDAVIAVDSKGRISFMNPLAENLTGWKQNNAQNTDINEVVQIVNINENIPFPIYSHELFKNNNHKPEKGNNMLLISKDLRRTPVDYKGTPLCDKNNITMGAVFVIYDITERKKSEEALWASEDRYRTLVENFSDAILIHSEGQINFINIAGVKLLKAVNAERVVGKYLSDFLPPQSTDIINNQIERIKIEQTKSPPVEGILLRSDNTEVDVEFIAIPYTHQKQDAVISVIRDITARKLLEEQLIQSQKMEAIGRLAGGIAHDFNNMLMAITGYSELVLGNLDQNDENRSDVREILKAADRAASLTRQLLTFSRRQQLKANVLELNTLVLEVNKMLKPIIGENIHLITKLEERIERINADPILIEQILMNLAINAQDAMPDGGDITIETMNVTLDEQACRLIPDSKPGNYVCLIISDTGTGMEQDIIQHIFEPFYSTKDTGKGTGLGLSVVYGCVKQHNGWISVFSEVGIGTSFKTYIPSVSIKHAEVTNETLPLENVKGENEGILVVEDEKDILEFVTRVLNDNGYKVFGASNSKEALKLFEKHENAIQLIFTDVMLPDITGVKLVEKLLNKKPGLPVIMTSGYSDEKSHWDEINKQGYTFIHKPYDLNSLFSSVKNALTRDKKIKSDI